MACGTVSRYYLPVTTWMRNRVADFYDELTPLYHLIHQDWDASVRRQADQLASIIENEWPKRRRILDVTCGIGTQAIGLAGLGFAITASDLSEKEIERARQEAQRHDIAINFSTCDVRTAHTHHGTGFDIVISVDNSLPHLLTDEDLSIALREMSACLAPGGGILITMRDYETEPRGKNIVKPYGTRIEDGKRHHLFQIWDFEGDHYDLAFFFVEEDLGSGEVAARVMRSKYYAISTGKMCELMRAAGFQNVRRIDNAFYQPVLIGTKPGSYSSEPTPTPSSTSPAAADLLPAIGRLLLPR
jgi:SAM-dependent methyltransferase